MAVLVGETKREIFIEFLQVQCRRNIQGIRPRMMSLYEVYRVPKFFFPLKPLVVDSEDGKKQGRLTLFPFFHGRSLRWDTSCINTYAETLALSERHEVREAQE